MARGQKPVVDATGTMFPANVVARKVGIGAKMIKRAAKEGQIRHKNEPRKPVQVFSLPDTLSWYESLGTPAAASTK
jgi:hypothetical protein